MDIELKGKFLAGWADYFPGARLPLGFWYTNEDMPALPKPGAHQCLIGTLDRAWKGETLRFGTDSLGCMGGKRFCGYLPEAMPNFEYFLSVGIPGKLEGERYKKSPELVRRSLASWPTFHAPAKYLVFKRFDLLEESDEPSALVFIAPPEVLSGLFTLCNFDEADPDGVFSPFTAGCGAIITYPYREQLSERPRGVLGLFDPSARPFVPEGCLSFSVPVKKFIRMVNNMDESFLVTRPWEGVRSRMT